MVVAPARETGQDLLRRFVQEHGPVLGWEVMTLRTLTATLAAESLARDKLAPVSPLMASAVMARVVHAAERDGRFAELLDKPGLSSALLKTAREVREAGVDRVDDDDLMALLQAYAAELETLQLADDAEVSRRAVEIAQQGAHRWAGVPALVLDVALGTVDAGLVEALAVKADVVVTLPAGARCPLDTAIVELGIEAEGDLAQLQHGLFGQQAEDVAASGGQVQWWAASDEADEAEAIAKEVLQQSANGTPFDEMAVLTRDPATYTPHLVAAFERGGVPAHFSRGTVWPDPSGRALLALLDCAFEGLSARAFAEYLSLGMVPAAEREAAWVPAETDLLPTEDGVAEGVSEEEASTSSERVVRAPRRWDALLVDAAVIGGLDRWQRRLDGLHAQLEAEAAQAALEGDGRADYRRRQADDAKELAAFALPIVEALAALPEGETWGAWLDALTELAAQSIARPERVLQVLAELAPMKDVGPVSLTQVRRVLGAHLTDLRRAPEGRRYGKVLVVGIDEARGLDFEVVFLPGVVERAFPRKVREDPLCLDELREGGALKKQPERIEDERLMLRLAAGAARERLMVSYPRFDVAEGRARVPSFYNLELLRPLVGAGEVPGMEALAKRTVALPGGILDRAALDRSLLAEVGGMAYVRAARERLTRHITRRAQRWQVGPWTDADGLWLSAEGLAWLEGFRLSHRAYSPTSLERYAACPYRFFLGSVLRLRARDEVEELEALNPLVRGRLVHEGQRRLLVRMKDEGLLPLDGSKLDAALTLLGSVLAEVGHEYREQLAPAIEAVWEQELQRIAIDMRQWLRRVTDEAQWMPAYFELGFGMTGEGLDTESVAEPVALKKLGITLRGAIDLVEQSEGQLRATDYKTGKSGHTERGQLVAGGTSLQPLLYGMVLEQLFPASKVVGGRLDFCTSRGDFRAVDVPLESKGRKAVKRVVDEVQAALGEGRLVASPDEGACGYCDYQLVCGPHEERRQRRKDQLVALKRLRELP